MKFSILITAILLSTIAIAQPKLNYQFSIDSTGSKTRLRVQVKFTGNNSGKTTLHLPDRWASQTELYKAVVDLKAETPGVSIDTGSQAHLRILKHKPNQAISIRYALEQDWKGNELRYPENYRAVINKKYIHLTGYSLLVFPAINDSSMVQVSLDWKALPSDWTVSNSLHTGSRQYSGRLMMKDFVNSIYMAGDYRLHQAFIKSKPVWLAIRGQQWKYSDTALLQAIEKVIGSQRDFWNDHSESYYLITMSPFEGQGSYNGSALHQAFMAGMTTEFELDSYLYGLLSHEYFHRWNGILITLKGQEEENAWLGEGFTEYYTWKLLYKAGLINFNQWLGIVNKSIAEYYLSPARNDNKEVLGKNYWGSRTYQQIPYKKGFTYALYLDQFLQSASAGKYSLDLLMFALRDTVHAKKDITEKVFVAILKKFSGRDLTSEHHDYIALGKTIPVDRASLGDSIQYEVKQLGQFDPGFDMDASLKNKIIAGVKPNTEAWKAGIRDGQALKTWSVYYDNISVPMEVVIKDENGKDKKISYLPVAAEKIEVPQFVLSIK
ncbi:MAG TPA: M1 family aminopeptidase [Chitinophagaceae bacterium]|nr:M1 family aminopeptidase [Chitinophagaceae bacterium]